MTEGHSGPATSPAGPQGHVCEWCHLGGHAAEKCPMLVELDPLYQALALNDLLAELAEHRSDATVIYADAYLLAEGTAEARTQQAKRTTAEAHLKAELAAARVAAYQHLIERRLADRCRYRR